MNAQQLPTGTPDPIGTAMQKLGTRQASLLGSGDLALEGAIDENEYIVGPGDMFAVLRGGTIPISTSIQVSAEGNLVVPEVGSLPVAGLSLADAKTAAVKFIKTNYVNEVVDVSLEEPRKFYVHVTGAVPQPGRFITSAVSRVDDVLQEVYASKSFDYNIALSGRNSTDKETLSRMLPLPSAERPSLNEEFRPSLRSIRIERTDGTSVEVDLMTYYATGDVSLNPYLLDGDVLRVSAYRNEFESIRVSGAVPYQGYYAYRNGDTLDRILSIAFGAREYELPGDVRIVTRTATGSESKLVTVDEVAAGVASRTNLLRGDHIMVQTGERSNAGVFGWVKYPGTYPIVSGKSTLKQLVSDAGGITDDASVRLAYVERRAPTFYKATPGVSDLDFFGRVNYRTALLTQRVLVNVAEMLESDSDFMLEDGDVVVFPRDEPTVFVVGNVPAGGYLPYREGWTAADYIDAAGGMAALSRDVYVYASVTGLSYKGIDQNVRPGDTIFVDREPKTDSPELQALLVTERTSKRQLKLASIQTIITGISTIAAIVTTVVAIRR